MSAVHRRNGTPTRKSDLWSYGYALLDLGPATHDMAVNVLSVEELLRVVRRYYPAGLDVYEHDQQYRDSPETRARKEARQRASEERGEAWEQLKQGFRDRFPSHVWDRSLPWIEPCFHFRVYVPPYNPGRHVSAVLLVSVLAPVHITFTSYEGQTEPGPDVFMVPRPETEAVRHELDQEATRRMESAHIDWRVLHTPVPEISTDHREFGKATLGDLLFTDGWW
jgi:hypothetical protein